MTRVGPVLAAEPLATAICEVLRAEPGVEIQDRGSYLRVAAEGRLRLDRAAVEARLGRPFQLPADLERVMVSFAGRLVLDGDGAVWEA